MSNTEYDGRGDPSEGPKTYSTALESHTYRGSPEPEWVAMPGVTRIDVISCHPPMPEDSDGFNDFGENGEHDPC